MFLTNERMVQMNTIKISIPFSYYDDVLNYRGLGESWPDTVFVKMELERDKAWQERRLGKKKNFYMDLTADELQEIVEECEGTLEMMISWDAEMLVPYRYMLKQAKKKLAELNSK